METPKPIREFVETAQCLGEYGLMALQDILLAVDDAIVELPDY